MKLFPEKRPYWHVDAKWICGVLLIFSLGITFCLYALDKLTDEKHGSTVAALVVGAAFVRSDSAVDIEEAKQELAKHGGQIQPLPNFPSIVITEKDLSLSQRDIKLKVFKPITDSIYNDGLEATAARFATTPEQKKEFINDAFFFRLFTKDTHKSLHNLFIIFSIVSLVLLVGLVYFSAGWGRLANPGLLLIVVSLPWTFLSLMLSHVPKNKPGDTPLGFLPTDLADELGSSLGKGYSRITLLGVILLLSAGAGKVIWAIHKRRGAKPPKTSSETTNS